MEERKRSKNYPGASLRDSVENLKAVHAALGLGAHKREDISIVIGSPKLSGSSARKIAAMVAFGLMSKSGDGCAITQLGKKIVRPLDGEEQDLLIQAFQNVALYREVFEAYSDEERLPDGMPIILERKFGIADGIGEYCFRFLRESAITAGLLLPDGTLAINRNPDDFSEDVDQIPSKDEPEKIESNEQPPVSVPLQSPHHPAIEALELIVIDLPRPRAQFKCPKVLSKPEAEKIKSWMDSVLKNQLDLLVDDAS